MAQGISSVITHRLKKKWKLVAFVCCIWLWVLFPIPFLPLFNAPYDPTSLHALAMIAGVASIPFTLLALFMNDGRRNG